MEYIRVKVYYISDNLETAKDKILNVLSEYNILEYELIEDFTLNKLDFNDKYTKNKNKFWEVIFYLPKNNFLNLKLDKITNDLENLEDILFNIQIDDINDSSYLNNWKKYFKTTTIYKDIVVSPTWDDYENKNEKVIKIDPGLAFGTGIHETTSLCIEAMYEDIKSEKYKSLLDIGCGSGILMLVAKKLYKSIDVVGIDIDPLVEDVVKTNFLHNNLEKPKIKIENLVDNEIGKYDYIVSNILVDTLKILLPHIDKVCNANTIIVLSGILKEKLEDFKKYIQNLGFLILDIKYKNEWASVKMKKKDKDDVIAIDGPSSSGKSTVAKMVAKKLNFEYINTGSMYRAVALKAIENNIDLENKKALIEIAKNINIDIKNDRFFLDNVDVTDKLRDEKVGNIASIKVSTISEIRKEMVNLQRKMALGKKVVLDGRDITSVVFPNAKLKIYLDADPKVRAHRRYEELIQKGINISFDDVYQDVLKRDDSDKNRSDSPLLKTEDAYLIDATNLSIDQVVNEIIRLSVESEL